MYERRTKSASHSRFFFLLNKCVFIQSRMYNHMGKKKQPCFKAAWAEHRKLHKTGGGAAAGGAGGVDPHAKTPQDG